MFLRARGNRQRKHDIVVTLEVHWITEYLQRTKYAASGKCGSADIEFHLVIHQFQAAASGLA